MTKPGVLVISHGSRSAEWVRLVDEAVADVRLPAGVPVFSSFLEIVDGRLIPDGIAELERQGVTSLITVPLFVSSGSTHLDEIAYALGVSEEPALPTDLGPLDVRSDVVLCRPLDDDPEIAGILYEKLRPLSEEPSRETVLLIGHGSKEAGFHRRWRQGMRGMARQLRELGGFASVETAMLLPDQAACVLRALQKRNPGRRVLVAPLFLSEGYFTNQVIPQRLQGLEYRYNGKAMLPHPLISRWMERRIREQLAALGWTEAAEGTGKQEWK